MNKYRLHVTPRSRAFAHRLTPALAILALTGALWTAQAQTTTLVSANRAGNNSGNGGSGIGRMIPGSTIRGDSTSSSVSADGRFVVFASGATDLVAGTPTNGKFQIYVRDLRAGTTALVSANRAGTGGGNGDSADCAISGDGRFVLFTSFATDLTATSTPTTVPTCSCGIWRRAQRRS